MVKRSLGVKRGRGRPKKNAEPQLKGFHSLTCECGNVVEKCDINNDKVTCSTCTMKLVPAPETKVAGPKYEGKTDAAGKGWGRGWWFKKKFVAPDGSVWKRGKKVSDAE